MNIVGKDCSWGQSVGGGGCLCACICECKRASVGENSRIFVIVRCLAVLVSICVSHTLTNTLFFCVRVSMYYISNDDQKYGRKERNIYQLHHHEYQHHKTKQRKRIHAALSTDYKQTPEKEIKCWPLCLTQPQQRAYLNTVLYYLIILHQQ